MRMILPSLFVAAVCAISAAQAADVAAGRVIFDGTCKNCHSLEVGVNKVGPSLWHVVGRPSASVQDYPYSAALRGLHSDWTVAALNDYLEKPREDVHGAQMFFKGLPDPKDRANVIAYLKSQQ